MQLPFSSLLALAFLSASAFAVTSYRDSCGTDSQVLDITKLAHNGIEIALTTVSCPGFASLRNVSTRSLAERDEYQERQVTECADGGCTLDCTNLSTEQPLNSDCQTITDILVSTVYPSTAAASFTAPPQTMTYISYETCQYTYYNLDELTYSVCWIDFGYNGGNTANDCFSDYPSSLATAGGLCASPGVLANDWVVEVSYPFS